MKQYFFYSAGSTDALFHCLQHLRHQGCNIRTSPDESISHLLLPVPSFDPDGTVKGGTALKEVLYTLPENITVVGGNLAHPDLKGYSVIDLLKDPVYLAENASITAHCAVKLALQQLPVTLQGCPVLVIGWGRIGKCLAALLRQMGAYVSVSARKEADRAMLLALGYDIADITPPAYDLMRCRVIFNTVPTLLLSEELLENCRPECLKIELASVAGMEGKDIISARGLPNKDAPESSGILIAKSVLRLIAGKESTV